MKRLLSVFIIICIIFSLTACSGKDEKAGTVVSKNADSSVPSETVSSTVETVVSEPEKIPTVTDGFYDEFNKTIDIEDNLFLDSLVYTGYNLEKHRSDNLMWVYVLAANKRGKGWLSNIGYGGGSTGYETNEQGLPDIAKFERGGLVCATYVAYVYFNYLPNVAGIDVSGIEKAEDPLLANSWYVAAQKWVEDGYAKNITYTASKNGNYIKFEPDEQIPIGSLMVFQDYKNRNGHGTHVALYAGYKNGYHWVYHVGNDNGPEFCAVERMSCGPDPQWPLAVISLPTVIANGVVNTVKAQ